MHKRLANGGYPSRKPMWPACAQPLRILACIFLFLAFSAGAFSAAVSKPPETLPLREACENPSQQAQQARCLLDDVYRLGQLAARDPSYRAQYQKRALLVRGTIEAMPEVSGALKQEANFAIFTAGTTEEDAEALLEGARAAVCAAAQLKQAEAPSRTLEARCTLVQMLESFSREDFQEMQQQWADFSGRFPPAAGTDAQEDEPPDALGTVALVSATYATAIAADEPARAGSILLDSMIRTTAGGPRADYMAATFVALAAGYALNAEEIGSVPLWGMEPAIAQVLWIVDLHFTEESAVARDLAGSLAGFYGRSAMPLYRLPLPIRESARRKGARLAARLYQDALSESDIQARNDQLKEIVTLFSNLELPEQALEAAAYLHVESLGEKVSVEGALGDVEVLVVLDSVPGGKAQAQNVARRLLPVLKDLPDDTPGLPHALLKVVDVLTLAPAANTACGRRQEYADLRAMNERGRKLSETSGASDGIVPAHFELQADTLKIGIRAEDALEECSVSMAIPTEEENLRRKVDQLLETGRNSADGISPKAAGLLIMAIDQRLDALRDASEVERSETPALLELAQRLFEGTAARVKEKGEETSEDWADVVAEMAMLRRNAGDVSGALGLINGTRSALPDTPEAQAAMAVLLRMYPRLLRREEGTLVLDQRSARALVIAMAELGETEIAVAGLDQLEGYQKRSGQEALLKTLVERDPDKVGKAWLSTLPDDLYQDWQYRRWRFEASRLQPDRVSSWLMEDAARERRWHGILSLERYGRYGEIAELLEDWDDPELRERGALLLLEAKQQDRARKLAQRLAPAQLTRFFVHSAKEEPARAAEWLTQAVDSLLEVSDSYRRMDLAGDILCAAAPATPLAGRALLTSEQIIFLRHQGQGISVRDGLRQSFASCLFVFGDTAGAQSIITQISKPEARADAYLYISGKFRERGNQPAALQALKSGKEELKPLQGFTFRFGVQRLYRRWVLAGGVDDAYADAKASFPFDPKGSGAANAANRDAFESALEGLLEGTLETEGVPVAAELLTEVRGMLGSQTVRALAIRTIVDVSRQRGPGHSVSPLIPLVENGGFEALQESNLRDYVLALGGLGDAERATGLAGKITERRHRAELQAELAARLSEAGLAAPEVESLARAALRCAMEIDVGSVRLKVLATVAEQTAKAGVDEVARSAIEGMVSARLLNASANETIAEAFSGLRQLAPQAGSHRARIQVLRALKTYGQHYKTRSDDRAVQLVLDTVGGYDRYSRLAEDISEIREELLREGSPLTAAYYQESLRFWQDMAHGNPGEVLWSIRRTSVHDFLPDALDAGIDFFEFGLDLSRKELRKAVVDPSPAAAGDPGGLSLVDQRIADKLLILLAEKSRRPGEEGSRAAVRALEVITQAQRSPAAAALLKAATASASADGEAGLRSEMAAREWRGARGELLDLLGQSEKSKAQLASELSKLSEARMRFEADKGAAAERARRYLDIMQAAQDGVRKIPELLGEDEALMVYRLNSSVALLSVTTREGTQLFDLAGKRREGAREVRTASAQISASLRAGEALRVHEKSALPGAIPKQAIFDFSAAHRLYEMVVAPAKSRIMAKRHWMVIPDSELAGVPFQMLLSDELPASPDVSQIQAGSWLVKNHSITIVPSVAALLTGAGPRPSGQLPLLGIGDPVIGGWAPHGCNGPLAVADESQAAVDVAATASFDAALPDTACLLQELAKEVEAGPDDLYMNRRAVEAAIKQLSASERLAAYRRIVFATHGLTGGQPGYSEAGLVLTPPKEKTSDDDGYLSASEVMALRLNADLVVLSACDSAGGYRDGNTGGQALGEADSGRGSEVFEGLASAFLYAGARHLYVSHWRIEAPAASRLISIAFRALGNGGGSREYALALQQAQLSLLREARTLGEASPFYWAPISSVGY